MRKCLWVLLFLDVLALLVLSGVEIHFANIYDGNDGGCNKTASTTVTPVTYLYVAGGAGLVIIFILTTSYCIISTFPKCRGPYRFDAVVFYLIEMAWAFVGVAVVWVDNPSCSPPEFASVLYVSVILRLIGVFLVAPYLYLSYISTPAAPSYRHVEGENKV